VRHYVVEIFPHVFAAFLKKERFSRVIFRLRVRVRACVRKDFQGITSLFVRGGVPYSGVPSGFHHGFPESPQFSQGGLPGHNERPWSIQADGLLDTEFQVINHFVNGGHRKRQ
jgi:hypothetical protein